MSRLLMYAKNERVHRATITERTLFSDGVLLPAGDQSTLLDFCVSMISRADIEGSKSNVAMNVWLPQACYPCGNFLTPLDGDFLDLKYR